MFQLSTLRHQLASVAGALVFAAIAISAAVPVVPIA